MCSFFAHGYQCHFERRMGECTRVHDQEVKNTFDLMVKCAKNGETFTREMRTGSLDPENKLPKERFEVKKTLFEGYPRRPTKKERERIEEQKKKVDIEKTFHQMYTIDND